MLCFQLRQRNSNTRATVPLGDHLAAYEAAAAKCTKPMDPATTVFMCRITLHPALQSATRINPQTNHEFSTYQELREYLVQFKPEAERLIRDWEKLHSGSTPRQFNGGSSRPFNGGGQGSLCLLPEALCPQARLPEAGPPPGPLPGPQVGNAYQAYLGPSKYGTARHHHLAYWLNHQPNCLSPTVARLVVPRL